MEPGRGQEVTGKGSLDHNGGSPGAPLVSPKGRLGPFPTPHLPPPILSPLGLPALSDPGSWPWGPASPPAGVPEDGTVPPLSDSQEQGYASPH